MVWKNIKTHFDIEHIVQVDGDKIKIGSGYLPDMIQIDLKNPTEIEKARLVDSGSVFFALRERLNKDLNLVAKLVKTPDIFEKSITVFTYAKGEVFEKFCEETGWPNVTHDGFVMYENTFSTDRNEVIEWCIDDAHSGLNRAKKDVEYAKEQLKVAEENLSEKERIEKMANALKIQQSITSRETWCAPLTKN